MCGLLLSFIILLTGIAMVAFGGFFVTTSGIAIRALSVWLLFSGIFMLMAEYLFIRAALRELSIKKRQNKFLPQTDIRRKIKLFSR